MSHSMRLSIFNSLKLLSIAPTRFSSTIVMLKRFKQLKKGLQEMVISDQWSSYKEDDVAKAKFVKDTLLDDKWWDKVDYILSFTSPIYDVLRRTDTEASSLHLVYEMWDSMIEKESEGSTFYEVVHSILIDRWTKSSTPLHCLAHSLNPRYYSHEWISEDSNRVPPHQDLELTRERLKCFKRFFLDMDVRRKVNIEFANFSDGREGFDDLDSLNDRGQMDPKAWWLVHGINAPILQKVALKLLAQPCSSSCCERNWSTYSFIHSLKRNKMAPHRAEDLVFVHSNLRLLSRNTPQYHQEETKMWDVARDDFGSLNDCGILEIASLSLDEPELETMTNEQLMDHGNRMMDETDQAIERGKKVVQDTINVGTDTAAALKAQTEQMSRVVNELDSIHFSMKKASKLVKEIGRQVATDKCIMALLFLIVIGVIAIIIVKLVHPDNKDIRDIPGLAPPVQNRRLLWSHN
ncbi:putative plant SNARE 11 [Glycine max]|nr:putative plant SNARE 11 [Glycine max]